jgi:hypothetical protein
MGGTVQLSGHLEVELTDVLGQDLEDRVLIELFQNDGSGRYRNREKAGRKLVLTGIACASYRVRVAPSRYRPRQFFTTLTEDGAVSHRLAFPVQPNQVRGIQAPPYSQLAAPLRGILSEPDYGALPPLPKACLLNIAAKASATVLDDGMSCLDSMGQLMLAQQDRLLLRTRAAMEEATAHSPLFHEAAGALHPYDVREILIAGQGLDPGYSFRFA